MLPAADTELRWPVPQLPHGGPEAARKLADAYDRIAESMRAAAGAVGTVRLLCDADRGPAAASLEHVLTELEQQHRTVADIATESARALRREADRLAAAHEAHRLSLSRILKLGAVVVVTGAAAYVNLGAATPIAAAAVEEELAAASAAAGAAAAAGASGAAEAATLARLFATARGLVTFTRPQIALAEVTTGIQTVCREYSSHHLLPDLSLHTLVITGLGFGFSAAGGKIAQIALGGRGGTFVRAVVPTAGSSTAGALPDAADKWRQTGRFSFTGFAESAAKNSGGSVLGVFGLAGLQHVEKWKVRRRRPSPA
jgi:hypothetical protein